MVLGGLCNYVIIAPEIRKYSIREENWTAPNMWQRRRNADVFGLYITSAMPIMEFLGGFTWSRAGRSISGLQWRVSTNRHRLREANWYVSFLIKSSFLPWKAARRHWCSKLLILRKQCCLDISRQLIKQPVNWIIHTKWSLKRSKVVWAIHRFQGTTGKRKL